MKEESQSAETVTIKVIELLSSQIANAFLEKL